MVSKGYRFVLFIFIASFSCNSKHNEQIEIKHLNNKFQNLLVESYMRTLHTQKIMAVDWEKISITSLKFKDPFISFDFKKYGQCAVFLYVNTNMCEQCVNIAYKDFNDLEQELQGDSAQFFVLVSARSLSLISRVHHFKQFSGSVYFTSEDETADCLMELEKPAIVIFINGKAKMVYMYGASKEPYFGMWKRQAEELLMK